jgi:glycosyltransferase involved in cell wall biosynthesis
MSRIGDLSVFGETHVPVFPHVSGVGSQVEVVVDGIIYQLQPHGGISRIFSEILPRMCTMDDSLRVTVLREGTLRHSLPEHGGITYRAIPPVLRYLRPRRAWKPIIPPARRFVRRLWIGQGEGRIWHSTYFTMPGRWDGPSVVTVADMVYERFPDLFIGPGEDQFGERAGYDQFIAEKRSCVLAADAVLCISDTTRRDVRRFYNIDPERLYVTPLACGDVFRQLEGQEAIKGRPFFLHVGSRAHYKNFDGFIRAYSQWDGRREVTVAVVGGPWSAIEEKRLEELGIRDRIHLLTGVDDESLCRLYNQAAAFVHPSLYEGFGIPLLEAMACGCPVIASRIPSTREVVGGCPIYFDPGEMDALLNAFDVALSEGRDSQRVLAGLEWVRRYSWDKTAAQTLEVYRKISGC